jgi:hypothetical protein
VRGGFLKDSTVITAQLSQTWTDIVTSPNGFVPLETCTLPMELLSQNSKHVTQLLLTLSNEILNSLCQSNLRDPKKACKLKKCFWHKNRQTKSEKLWEEENKHVDEPHDYLFTYFRIFTPLADNHVIVSHVTSIT